MRRKIISLFIMASLIMTMVASATGCSVMREPVTPYYILNPYRRYTALEKPDVPAEGTLKITLAKNEGEGGQFSLYSKTTEFKNVVASVNDLQAENGDILTSDCIELFREEFTYYNGQTKQSLTERDGSAQILVPLSTGEFNKFDTVKGRNLIYYVKVTTPEVMNAGVYVGNVTLTHDDGTISVPIEVTVLDFSLQTRPVLRSDLLYWGDFTTRYYKMYDHPITDTQYNQLYDQALEICRSNKLTCTNAYDVPGAFDKTPEDYVNALKAFLEANPSISTFNAPIAYSDWGNRVIDTERTLPYLNALKDAGLLSMAIMYSVDEPHNETDFANLNRLGKWTDEYCPELQNYVPIIPSAIDWTKVDPGAIDIYCYAYGGCSTDELKVGQTGERTLWAYAFDKSTNLSHSQIRLMGWESKKFNIEGIEDWCLNSYTYGYENGQWLLNRDSAMLYSYVYPAMEGDGIVDKTMFLPTFIIEQFRDAVEDYEYLMLLESKVQEKIDLWGLDLTIHEAMESYYDGCFLDVHRLPDNEESGFATVRERVINEIQNGVSYIMTTKVDNKNWSTDNRYITVYTDKNSDILINGEKQQTKTTEKYASAEVYRTIGSESKTYTIECMGKTTSHHILSKDFDKKPVVELGKPEIYEALKQANPNTEFEIIKDGDKSVLKVVFGEGTKRGFVIPAEIMSTPVCDYNYVRMNAWSDSDTNEYIPVGILVSATATLTSDTEKYAPTTEKNVPFTLIFNKDLAPSVGTDLKSFRLSLNKSYKTPVTMYFSDIYFINENNNFKWEIVE
ncbi:MAG: hypothetical protein DBX47_01145 [Clostridiales bacterium]|nr:MAG: hypothetical protein DBX47_01145 [Clostridiales bacterium]